MTGLGNILPIETRKTERPERLNDILSSLPGHAFHQLGMHRVSLGVLGNNERAIALYKSM
jgi:hypothetical protein